MNRLGFSEPAGYHETLNWRRTEEMFKLEITTGNAAFEDDPLQEIARILRAAADRLEFGVKEGGLMDINGNRVGLFELTED